MYATCTCNIHFFASNNLLKVMRQKRKFVFCRFLVIVIQFYTWTSKLNLPYCIYYTYTSLQIIVVLHYPKEYGCNTLFKLLPARNTSGTRFALVSDASRTVTVNSWHGGDGFIRIWVPLQGVMLVVVLLSFQTETGGCGDRKGHWVKAMDSWRMASTMYFPLYLLKTSRLCDHGVDTLRCWISMYVICGIDEKALWVQESDLKDRTFSRNTWAHLFTFPRKY